MNRIEDREQKIIDFTKYAEKCRQIERHWSDEIETKIISIDEVREKKETMRKNLEKLVLEAHPYAITQMVGKDTRWCTAVKREGEKRKVIKKNTREEIIEFLIEFYDINIQKPKYTLRTMYPQWIAFKQSGTNKPAYIKRIHADWVKFYLNDPIIDVSLTKMTPNQITEWLNKRILVDGITKRKTFYNMICIFKGIFTYCYDEGIISENTFARAKYRKDLFDDETKPESETQVFNEEERDWVVEFALESFKENTKLTTHLAIALLFQTGLRCGELVALETTDYNKEKKTLSITKSECKDFEFVNNDYMKYKGVFIGPPKKSASKRVIELSDEACDIIDMIIKANDENNIHDGNYLFVYNNRRIQGDAVRRRLKKICDNIEIARRSPHKVRKTVLSELVHHSLNDDICDLSKIRQYAGQVHEGTLLKSYLFSTKGDEITSLVNTALQTKNYKDRHFLNNVKEA